MTKKKDLTQAADHHPEDSGLLPSSMLDFPLAADSGAVQPSSMLVSPPVKNKSFVSIKTKLTSFSILMGVLPVTIVGSLGLWQISDFSTKQIKSVQQERASGIADKMNRFLFERYGDVQVLASQPIFNDEKISKVVSQSEKIKQLDAYITNYQVYDSIVFFDIKGNPVVQSTGVTVENHADREYFQKAISTGQVFISKPEMSKSLKQFVMHFASPVKDTVTGKILGVVRTRAPLSRLEAPLRNMASKESAYHLFDTRTSQVFMSSNKEYLNKQIDVDIQKAQTEGIVNHINPLTNREELLTTAPFEKLPDTPAFNLVAVSTYDAVTAYQARQNLLFLLMLGAGTTTLLVAMIALYIANKTSTPLIEAADIVEKIGQGNLAERITTQSNDEVGALSSNINNMAGQLQLLLATQSDTVEKTQLLSLIAQAQSEEQLVAPLSEFLIGARKVIGADRLVIYRFLPNWGGHVAAEALAPGVPSAMNERISDNCIPYKNREDFANGHVISNYNVLEAGYHKEHIKLFERLDIKSNLVVPIAQNGNLIALLVAHHCTNFHNWSASETDVMTDLATQLATPMLVYSSSERTKFNADKDRAENVSRQQELIRLLSEIEGAATGDLTVRSEINEGEIAIVGDFFNSIIESLRDIVKTVKDSTAQVTTSVGDNESEIRLLATAANEQADKIEQTLRQVEAGAISIQSVAQSAREASVVATAASATAETGGHAMDNTVININQLRETVAETAKKVKRLGESSQQISKAVGLINQIALQTNLLAINASIEAARAGEEGRGFAVVAEEVAQLATQSSAATKEIEKIVSTIQRETSEVTQAMELSTAQVVEGTKSVEQTKLSLKEIIDQSKEIDAFLQSISQSAIEQVKSSESMKLVMAGVAEVSAQTSTSSSQVSNSLQATVAIARELQAVVGKFKVNADKN
jgi:methyl-accepting chemotaxis protein PixJ